MRPNSSALWALPVAKKISMGVVRRESGWGVEGRVEEESGKRGRGSAKVQIGAELLCKGGKVN